MRGPWQFLCDRQTGLPDLAMKSLGNLELIRRARAAAEQILINNQELKNYPLLKEKVNEFSNHVHLE